MSSFAYTFRISMVTLLSLLLALILGFAIRLNSQGRQDLCSAYLAGDPRAPSSEYVVTGTRTIIVPCRYWLPRQPLEVQVLCLVDLVLFATFLFNGLHDVRGWYHRRQRNRFTRE